jgi:hypothetical protein
MFSSFNILLNVFNCSEKKNSIKKPLLSYNCDIDNMTQEEFKLMVQKNNGEINNSDFKLSISKNNGRDIYWQTSIN